MSLDLIVVRGFGQQRGAPAPEREHGGAQVLPTRGEVKQGSGDGRGRRFATNHADLLELAEALREQIGRDPGHTLSHVRVSAGTSDHQLTDDEQ